MRGTIAILLAACIAAAPTAGAAPPPVPTRTGHVTDAAHALSADERRALEAMLADYEHETHHALAALTVADLQGEPIQDLSLRVANAWAPGFGGWNDGILVTLAVGEGLCRIEVGRGMERYVTNADAKAVTEQAIVPRLRQRDYAGALRAGLGRLMKLARADRVDDPAPPKH